jgi:hypothetical protein
VSLKDLIADVNVNEICEHIETETLSEWVNAWQEAALSALRPVSREQVEKVRHGRWIKYKYFDECSECYTMVILRYNYCPNCGARMGKENEQ